MTWPTFLFEVVGLPPTAQVLAEPADAVGKMAGKIWVPAGLSAPSRWGDKHHLQYLQGLGGSFAQQTIQPGEFDAHGMRVERFLNGDGSWVVKRRPGLLCLAVTPDNFRDAFWGAWSPVRSDEVPPFELYRERGCEYVDEATREIVVQSKRYRPAWPDDPKEPT